MTSHDTRTTPTHVDYDEEALRLAAERMHANPTDDGGRDADPEGDHAPGALHEAAKRTGAE